MLGSVNNATGTLSLVLYDHPQHSPRSVGVLKHVKRHHFARLRLPIEGKAGPGILQTCSGPTRPCVAQLVSCIASAWPNCGVSWRHVVPHRVFCKPPGTGWNLRMKWRLAQRLRRQPKPPTENQHSVFWRLRTAGSACAGGHTWHRTAAFCIVERTLDGACNAKKRSNTTGWASHIMWMV
jgi:hypothetical protein